MFEKRKLRRLKEYYEKIVHPKSQFPAGYIDDKRAQISTLEWLIAYYEGRAASTPKQLLEEYIYSLGFYNKNLPPQSVNDTLKAIVMLYDWVYKNKITGF